MKLFVINGVQYPEDKLPAGVDPSTCQTLDEWRVANRRPAVTKPATLTGAAEKPEVEHTSKRRGAKGGD